jgi:uncharacterized protein
VTPDAQMNRSFPRLIAGAAILLSVASTGCGRDAESVPPRTPPTPGLGGVPWEEISLDSLYGATPEENLRVTEAELDVLGIPEGWDGMRIVAISDLHLGLWEGNASVARAAAQRAAQLDPDLIVLLGDYLARGQDTLALREALQPLEGRLVMAVLGDRDVRTDSVEARVTRTLTALGIRVLKGSSAPLVRGNDTAYVAGVDPEITRETAADQAWVLSQLGAGRLGLLISHNPVVAGRAPRNRFPAAIAGGTFCGRVEMPGTPRLSWLNEQALPGATVPEVPRIFRFNPMVMFVTCGVGFSFVPIRFGAPPEVALVTLRIAGRELETEATVTPDTLAMDTLLRRFGVEAEAEGGN